MSMVFAKPSKNTNRPNPNTVNCIRLCGARPEPSKRWTRPCRPPPASTSATKPPKINVNRIALSFQEEPKIGQNCCSASCSTAASGAPLVTSKAPHIAPTNSPIKALCVINTTSNAAQLGTSESHGLSKWARPPLNSSRTTTLIVARFRVDRRPSICGPSYG